MEALRRRPGRLAVRVTAAVALTLTGLAAGFLYVGGAWGCPSQAELERQRSPEDVISAFADRGVKLARTPLPRTVSRDRDYRHAIAYRHVTPRAALFVLVCKARCVDAPQGLRTERIAVGDRSRQHARQFSTLGNNIAVFMTDNDRRSGRVLQARVQPALDELDAAVPYGSRCYIQ